MDTLPALPLTQPPIRVISRPSIFRDNSVRKHFTLPHGASLLDIAIESKMAEWRDDKVHLPGNVAITINGDRVDRQHWHRCRPRPGKIVNVFLLPGDQRQAILIGASILIAVAAVYTGGAAITLGYPILGAVGAAAISVGGAYDLREPWPAA